MKGIRLTVVKDCGDYIKDMLRLYDQNKKEKGGFFPNTYNSIGKFMYHRNTIDYYTVCALKDEKLVGYCFIHLDKGGSPTIQVNVLAVDENYRGQGIGEALLNFVKHRSRLCNHLFSEAMIKNIPSINLHLKLGFEKKYEEMVDFADFGKVLYGFFEIDPHKVEDNKPLTEGESIEI